MLYTDIVFQHLEVDVTAVKLDGKCWESLFLRTKHSECGALFRAGLLRLIESWSHYSDCLLIKMLKYVVLKAFVWGVLYYVCTGV